MILALPAIALPAAAIAAEPVNLHCSLDAPTAKRTIDITLNEADGTVSWQWDTSPEPIKNTAIFTATKVVMRTITIDRVTLAIQQDASGFTETGHPTLRTGQCEIVKVKRAF